MPREIGEPSPNGFEVLRTKRVLGDATVHLQRPDGGDDDGSGGCEAGLAAFDVEELFRAQIGAEAGLCNDVVGELEGRSRRHHRVAAMRDVGERAAMHEGRVILQRLHEVGHERVLEQHGHGAGRLDVGRGDRPLVAGVGHDHPAQTPLEVGEVGGKAEDRHHLGRHGDVEAVFPGKAVGDAAEAGDDRAERPVVHVDHPAPGHAPLVDAELVAPIDVVVEQGGEQVVGRADGVEVAGEVQVDLLHRNDLGVAAAGRTALHPEAGPERRLAQADHRLLADAVEAVAEADGRRGLAFAGRGRIDRGDQDQLAVGPLALAHDPVEVELGDVPSVTVQRCRRGCRASRRPSGSAASRPAAQYRCRSLPLPSLIPCQSLSSGALRGRA